MAGLLRPVRFQVQADPLGGGPSRWTFPELHGPLSGLGRREGAEGPFGHHRKLDGGDGTLGRDRGLQPDLVSWRLERGLGVHLLRKAACVLSSPTELICFPTVFACACFPLPCELPVWAVAFLPRQQKPDYYYY